jgi:hypothetical protein
LPARLAGSVSAPDEAPDDGGGKGDQQRDDRSPRREGPPPATVVTVSPWLLAGSLALAAFGFVVVGAGAIAGVKLYGWNLTGTGFASRVWLDGEATLPGWFAASTLLLAAALAALIAAATGRGGRHRWHWWGLAAICALLSADEAAAVHELVGTRLEDLPEAGGWLRYRWVIPGAVFVVALAAAYGPFLVALPAATRRRLLAAGALYFGGALGFEVIAARVAAAGRPTATPWLETPHLVLGVVEEALEMAGAILLVYALAAYAGSHLPALRLDFADLPAPRPDGGTERAPGGACPAAPAGRWLPVRPRGRAVVRPPRRPGSRPSR